MTQEIKRVIVPLDATSETGTAIDTAAHLAARWRVPLHGVFIEDEELIDLAGLPFARQVTLGAGLEALTKDHIAGRGAVERQGPPIDGVVVAPVSILKGQPRNGWPIRSERPRRQAGT